jgi:hypothetical protein
MSSKRPDPAISDVATSTVTSVTAPPGGTQFYSALQAKAMAAVKDTFKSVLYPVQYPAQGDFFWNWQNSNQVFNNGTYQYINALVSSGEIPNTVALSSAGSFANAYVTVLNAMTFSLSSADQNTLANAQSNASVQAGTIVADYQSSYGQITAAQMAAAGVQTKQDYVIGYVLGSQWSGATPPLSYTQMASARNLKALLPKAPIGADQTITDVTVYLNLMQPVNGLSDQLQNGTWTLAQLKGNAMYPSATNGGVQTFDPNTGATLAGYNDGWAISSAIASINNDLQNTSRVIELAMTTSQSSSDSLEVTVSGQTGFSIGSWLQFSTQASGSYDMSRTSGTSMNCSVSITYAGYSMVPMAPAAWQQATNSGFYAADPINKAIANSGQDVTGFKFLNAPGYTFKPLASGGNFGLLTNLLIANYPTISITYQDADYATFSQKWQETVSGNLTLFGFIKLGSFSQGTFGSKVTKGANNSSFTVTFSASPQVTSVPQNQRAAYVIGAAVTTPGPAA